MVYRAVIFDLFGTLVPNLPAALAQSLTGMAAAVGAEPAAFHRLWVHDTVGARMMGAYPSVESSIACITDALGLSPTPEQLAEAARIRLAFYRASLAPRPDAVATLAALRARGLRLGLISDCSCEAPLLWHETPFAPLIDAPVFSCLEGTKKPDPRLYRTAGARLGVPPEECLYVADGYSRELSGARALGMRAALIAVPGEALADYTENEGATWTGDRVVALSQVLELL